MITFTLILFAVRAKDSRKEPQSLMYSPKIYDSLSDINSQSSHYTVNLETDDRDYWPARETIV